MASPGYFQTLGVGLLVGREFTTQDGPLAPRVIVINQTAARRFFASRDPLGQEIEIPGGGQYAVVGVVRDVHHRGLDAVPRPEMFVPFEQYYSHGNMSLVVRTVDDPVAAAAAIAAEVHAIDRDQPVGVATPVTELIDASVSSRRFSTILLASLAGLGLLLAALGVYGVMAVSVAQRRTEMGIRLALGAGPAALVRMVVGQSMRFAFIGILTGPLAHSSALWCEAAGHTRAAGRRGITGRGCADGCNTARSPGGASGSNGGLEDRMSDEGKD